MKIYRYIQKHGDHLPGIIVEGLSSEEIEDGIEDGYIAEKIMPPKKKAAKKEIKKEVNDGDR